MSNKMSFVEKLTEELTTRGWTQADLARASGLKRAVISKTLNQTSSPTPDTLSALAKALNKPPEELFRWAGILPPKPETDPLLEEVNYKLSMLPPDLQEDALKYLEFLFEKQEQRNRGTNLDLKKSLGTSNSH